MWTENSNQSNDVSSHLMPSWDFLGQFPMKSNPMKSPKSNFRANSRGHIGRRDFLTPQGLLSTVADFREHTEGRTPSSILKNPSYRVGGAVGMRRSSSLAVWEDGVHIHKPRQQSDQKLQRRKRGFVRGICELGSGFEGKGFPSHTRLERHKQKQQPMWRRG